MSARRVVAMAAIIGDAHGGRQGINDTLKSIAPVTLSQVTRRNKCDIPAHALT
jgi:hypothetical protein